MQRNAAKAKSDTFQYKLYLSTSSQAAYKSNIKELKKHAPDVEVVDLEPSAFFKSFKDREYFEHYTAALTGNNGQGPNFASAADVLRYQLMYHEGGIYMDVDDFLQKKLNVRLNTSNDGLLLNHPVNIKSVGKFGVFNNNNFGTHAKNPILIKISKESLKRFRKNPELYK